ncbi:MAG: helix-turn-helix domain-containing protein [Microcystis aeruginosa LG13-11]|nr:helix-turn-helix domain-containing protein [Microcystis aeruginosa LG13-11]
MEKAYSYRFYPTPEQESILAAGLAVSVRFATIRPEQSKSVKAGAEPRKGKKQKPKS